MKRFRLILILLVAVAIVAFIFFTVHSERQRVGIIASIETPPELEFHERLAEAVQNTDEQSSPPPELKPALEIMTRWASLFARKTAEVDGEEWNSVLRLWHDAEGWNSLSIEDKARIVSFLDSRSDFLTALRAQTQKGGPIGATSISDTSREGNEHLIASRDCARLLRLDAIARARTGAMDLAVDNCVAGFQLSEALASEPAYLSQLVRHAITIITISGIMEAFPPGQLHKADMDRLGIQASGAAHRDAFVLGLQQYQIESNQSRSAMLKLNWHDRHGEMQFISDRRLKTRVFRLAYSSPLARPWVNKDVAQASLRMGHQIELARMPYYEAVKNMGPSHTRPRPFQSPYAALVARAELVILQGQTNHEVRLKLLQVGLALEHYQHE